MAMVVDDSLDLTFSFQVSNGNTSEGSVDLHSVNQSRLRNHLESRNFFEDSIICGLIQDYHILGLVLDLSFRPFLLLGILCCSRGLSREERRIRMSAQPRYTKLSVVRLMMRTIAAFLEAQKVCKWSACRDHEIAITYSYMTLTLAAF